MIRFFGHLVLFLLIATLSAQASGAHFFKNGDEIVLTVTGEISKPNQGLVAKFNMAGLEQLPRRVVRTANPWLNNVAAYEGVLLRDLLAAVGAKGTMMTVSALDDYHENIPVIDAQSIDVILAYKRDGQYMPIRDKGPLFVVFPFTDDPALETQTRWMQSVWQVQRIDIQ